MGCLCSRAMPREGRKRKKRKERSNKEVDRSAVHARALNTFLLHFNGFLKSIFMQIKACLSKEFTKARPGARPWVGLPEPSLVPGGCNLPPFLKGHTAPAPFLAARPRCRHTGHLTPTTWYHYTPRNCGCRPQPQTGSVSWASLEWWGPNPSAKTGASPCQEQLLCHCPAPAERVFHQLYIRQRATELRGGGILQMPVGWMLSFVTVHWGRWSSLATEDKGMKQ